MCQKPCPCMYFYFLCVLGQGNALWHVSSVLGGNRSDHVITILSVGFKLQKSTQYLYFNEQRHGEPFTYMYTHTHTYMIISEIRPKVKH